MKGILRALFLAALAVTVAVPTMAGGEEPQGELRGNAERGGRLFVEYHCYACHGYTGETGSGARLNPPRLNQPGFITYLRNPPRPNQMPPYRQEEASDQNLADIFAFISGLESNSPDVEDIEILTTIIDEVE